MRLSFLLQSHTEKLAKVYQPLRSALVTNSKVSVAHLLAARQDFSKILRTSSGKIREKTACAINKVSHRNFDQRDKCFLNCDLCDG